MWEVNGREVDLGAFELATIEENLYEYDGPRTFTFRDNYGELYFAHFCDEEGAVVRYVVVPFSEELVGKLTAGVISILEALNQPRLFVIDTRGFWAPTHVWRTELSAIPPETLPDRSVMLWPSLDPLLSLRSIGPSVGEGTTPASVIADVVDGAKKAVRILVEYVREVEQVTGRPPESRRKWYDLPTQRLQFTSFEVSFAMPPDDPQGTLKHGEEESKEMVYQKVGALLQKGITWLTDGWTTKGEWKNDEERKVVLQAIESLIPSSVGPVRTLQLRGRLVSEIELKTGKPVTLDRESKRFVRSALSSGAAREELIIRKTGFVRELDKDRFTFDLRKNPDDLESSTKFYFEEELAEDVSAALYMDEHVEVVGLQTHPKRIVAKIIRLLPQED